jgi:hypothetical protein
MSFLNWRNVREIELFESIIPDPTDDSRLVKKLTNVSIAYDGGFIHIDPREADVAEQEDINAEFVVHAVPVSSVRVIRYLESQVSEPEGFGTRV